MKPKTKKALKRVAIIATGVFTFIGSVVGGYLVTGNRTKYIDISSETPEPTAFGLFVDRITKDIGLSEGEEEAQKYLRANFDNIVLTYKQSADSQTVNTVTLDGNVDFRMSALSLSGVEFSIDAIADYNGRELPLTMGRFRKDVYFGLKNLKMKFTDFSVENLIYEYWYAFAHYANLSFPTMLEGAGHIVQDKLGGLIDGLMNGSNEPAPAQPAEAEAESSGFDFSSILTDGAKEELINGHWHFWIGKENSDFYVEIITSNDYALERVDLGTLKFGNVTLSGALNVEFNDYEDFVSPAAGNDYIEVFNYTGLTHRIATLLKEDGQHQKTGFEFSLDLDNIQKPNNPIDIAKINGSINVNFDQLLDLSQYSLDENGNSSSISQIDFDQNIVSIENLADKIGFNVQVDLLGQGDIEYSNLDLSFAQGEGYIRFNEQQGSAVMKLKMDTQTTNWLVNKIPDLINSTSGNDSNTSLDTLSGFLTDDLMDAVNEGDFSFILDMIETLENDQDGIRLGLNLSSLGIGENARVNIEVENDSNIPNFRDVFEDPNLSEEQKNTILGGVNSIVNSSKFSISAENITFGDYLANVSANTADFAELSLGNPEDYQSVKFIPDVIDQISEYTQSKKTGFSMTGTMKDSAGLGISFTGRGQLDNNDVVKEGFGNMEIKQYKYSGSKVWATHNIAVNVTNLDSKVDKAYDKDGNLISQTNNNEALFVYGDPSSNKNVKGKMHLQTFSDILDIIKTFVNDFGNTPKFSKFLGPIMEMMGFGAIGDIINQKDYVKLTCNDVLKEVSVINNGGGIRIVISKDLIGLPSDITIEIAFNGDNTTGEGTQTLKSLTIKNLVLSDAEDPKKLNMTFTLEDYDENMVDAINKNATYMNLDGIKTLLDLGINTTKPNFYHLTADATVKALVGIINIPVKGIDFYVYVNGEVAKVYGTISDIPTSSLYTEDYGVGRLSHKQTAEFSFETFNDDQHDGVNGVFNIHRKLVETFIAIRNWLPRTVTETKEWHYRADGTGFMDGILKYLLGGLLGINSSYISEMGGDASTSSSERDAGDFTKTFTDTGFLCDTVENGMGTVTTIQVGLNLDQLTGISILHELEATIKSKRHYYLDNTQTIDILDSLHVELNALINASVTLNANVAEVQFTDQASLSRWNATGESGLVGLRNNINGLAIGENSPYYNNPDKPYKYSHEKY